MTSRMSCTGQSKPPFHWFFARNVKVVFSHSCVPDTAFSMLCRAKPSVNTKLQGPRASNCRGSATSRMSCRPVETPIPLNFCKKMSKVFSSSHSCVLTLSVRFAEHQYKATGTTGLEYLGWQTDRLTDRQKGKNLSSHERQQTKSCKNLSMTSNCA